MVTRVNLGLFWDLVGTKSYFMMSVSVIHFGVKPVQLWGSKGCSRSLSGGNQSSQVQIRSGS